jgi:hypothetical protein
LGKKKAFWCLRALKKPREKPTPANPKEKVRCMGSRAMDTASIPPNRAILIIYGLYLHTQV